MAQVDKTLYFDWKNIVEKQSLDKCYGDCALDKLTVIDWYIEFTIPSDHANTDGDKLGLNEVIAATEALD